MIQKFGDSIDWDKHVRELLEKDKDPSRLFYKADENDLIIKNIKKYKPNGGNLLDCGCHIGRWCPYFEGGGFTYTGIDQSEKALRIANKYYPNGERGRRWIHKFLWDMDFDHEFDIVVSISMLQHNRLYEKKLILPRIYKALKDDGIFFMTESTLEKETNTQLTPSGWMELVENNGFKFTESWHPSVDINSGKTFNDCYLFKNVGGLDIKPPKLGGDEELNYYVEQTYLNILCRGADDGGKRRYVDMIKKGLIKREDLVEIFRNSEEYKNKNKEIYID